MEVKIEFCEREEKTQNTHIIFDQKIKYTKREVPCNSKVFAEDFWLRFFKRLELIPGALKAIK